MLFLLIRIIPYLFPIIFFSLVKALFYFPDQWPWVVFGIVALSIVNFGLLKLKDKSKNVFWLAIWSLAFTLAGTAYILILEHVWIINSFLIIWSLVYWLYLESVFHDFYETQKTYILNLSNITLYGNILIIFFLTASLASFYIFLNFPWLQIFPLLAVVYFSLFYLAYLRQRMPISEIKVYSFIGALVLFEFISAVSYLPSSIYVLASTASLSYYILMSLSLLGHQGKLSQKLLWRYLSFFSLVMIVVLVTAAWF